MTLAGERARAGEESPRGRYAYRREPTPGGLEKMRRGDLERFDLEMYANFNTGVLEEYLDERNRTESFRISRWDWRQILAGIAVGTAFVLINMYVGLKIGLIVYGAWYVAYFIGLGLRWRPAQINLSAGAANGTALMVIGFVYVFPSLFLLSPHNSALATPLVSEAAIPGLALAGASAALAGILGTLYFIVFRRVWLVDDPLPFPHFESYIKLLDMTNDLAAGAADRARRALRYVFGFTAVSGAFTILKEFPAFTRVDNGQVIPESALDRALAPTGWYAAGEVAEPTASAHYSWFNFTLSPLLFAVGWFMRLKPALIVGAGALVSWLVVAPMAVFFNVPVFVPELGGKVGLQALWAAGSPSAILAHAGVGRTLAAGALLGAGLTALVKMTPAFRSTLRDLFRIGGEGRGAYEPGRGWYEWPPGHILAMLAVTAVAIPALFVASGYPLGASLLFALLFVTTTFFLGAISCKVLGETSIEPVSGTSFIVFLLAFGLFALLGMPMEVTVVMGLLGTTIFATAIAMTGDILLDYKNSLYVGTRPFHQTKANLAGVVPGAVASVLAATLLSVGLAQGTLQAAAPQANAFATLVQAIVGGHVNLTILALGFAIGVLAEGLTGMGTAFALGMFFTLGFALPLILGGALRDGWEKRLNARAAAEAWPEERKTRKLLDSYMIATGLIVGEAVIGTMVAVYLTFGLLVGG